MIRHSVKQMSKSLWFNSLKQSSKEYSSLSSQMAKRYPIEPSKSEVEQVLSQCEKSQAYTLTLLENREKSLTTKLPFFDSQKKTDNRYAKYTQVADSDEVEKALKEAEATRAKFSIY